jgi:hypothetical protein
MHSFANQAWLVGVVNHPHQPYQPGGGGPLKAPLASTKANDVVYPLSLSNPIFYRYLPLEFYFGGASKEPPASDKPALYP